jgi:hypothetical protein
MLLLLEKKVFVVLLRACDGLQLRILKTFVLCFVFKFKNFFLSE